MEKNRLSTINDRLARARASRSFVISEKQNKVIDDLESKIKPSQIPVTLNIKSANDTAETKDPLSLFKSKGPSLFGIIAPLAFLFKDQIFDKIKDIIEFIKPFTRILGHITTRAVNVIETTKENIKTVVPKTITTSMGLITRVSPFNSIALLMNTVGIGSDEILEKISDIGDSLNKTIKRYLGFEDTDSLIMTIATGKFGIAIFKKLYQSIKTAFNDLVSFTRLATNKIKSINSAYVTFPTESDTKIKSKNDTLAPMQPGEESVTDNDSTEAHQNTPVTQESSGDTNLSETEQSSPGMSHASPGWISQPITTSDIDAATIVPFNYKGQTRWTSSIPWLRAMIGIESAGNPNADNGTYEGLFQLNRNYAMFKRGNRFNAQDNLKMAKTFWKSDIMTVFRGANIELNATNLYLGHQQGAGGTKDLYLRARRGDKTITPGMRQRMAGNFGVTHAADYIGRAEKAVANKESMMRSISGGKGGDSVKRIIEVLSVKTDEDIPEIIIDKIPSSLNQTQKQPRQNPIQNQVESPRVNSAKSTTIDSVASDVRAPRVNSQSIIQMSISARLL